MRKERIPDELKKKSHEMSNLKQLSIPSRNIEGENWAKKLSDEKNKIILYSAIVDLDFIVDTSNTR